MEKSIFGKKNKFLPFVKSCFWFFIGATLGLFFFTSFVLIGFQKLHTGVVYPGVMVNGVSFGGKTKEEVKNYFAKKNTKIADSQFAFVSADEIATISAKQLEAGYDEKLLAIQAFSVGRSGDYLSDLSLILQAYLNGVNLSPFYHYSDQKLEEFLKPFTQKINVAPIDALFTFEEGRVSAFRVSQDGQEVDVKKIKNGVYFKTIEIVTENKPKNIAINIPIKILKPKISTEKVNDFGIKEAIGTGTSLFQGSIPGRIYNITLASTRINGLLVAPNEIFSFNKALGDISAFTGYKQAYIIREGRTVLGDGGGVCQVSTTFFRAILDAGLPVVERHAHAYRVGYYEQDSPPGLDATVYSPEIDLKFKNDTSNYILIQSYIDPNMERLTFTFYGTKDGRQVAINKPVITSQSPPPEPLYQDDPTLAKGVVKQVDFSAWGANVYFTREVVKNGKTILNDKFVSNYRAWQAIYLRGTKE